jgi:hypothetical protein
MAPPPPPLSAAETQPRRLPFSQLAIWGFVISCLSLFIFGIIGVLGVALSARGFRAARMGTARGRGLAIAGMIIGALGFLFYAINFFIMRH